MNSTVVGIAVKSAERLNPITNSPSAPLKSQAYFDSFGPSLMPRATMHQGMAAGLAVLAADLVVTAVDGVVRQVIPSTSPASVRIGTRAGIAAVGMLVSRIPETDDEHTAKASLRAAGRLATAGAVGGIIYESAQELRNRYPARSPMRPIVGGTALFAAGLVYGKDLLTKRQEMIQRWTDDDKPASLVGSLGIGMAVAAGGRGVGRGFVRSRRAMAGFFGPGVAQTTVGRTLNTALWAAGAVSLYLGGVNKIAQSNEKIEPAYSEPPDNEFVSGGPNSISPFEELGLQGRRFVSDVVTPDLIESTMGKKAKAHPIRAYVGVNSEPLYPSGRSEMMLDELEKLGAFDRKYLLLISPTGTGWVDQTMIEAIEIFTRGDIATACIQYGRGPSFLEVQKVHLGRSQFRGLLWGVRERLRAVPEKDRPRVLVFGESLGAWSSSDVMMHQGMEGFDHYGIDHALWFGLPGLAKWSKTGMARGSTDLVPEGTIAAFDNFEQYEALSDEEKEKLRAIVVDHDNDPIAQMSARWAVKEPPWLAGDDRGRNVPDKMTWIPVITLVHIVVDAMNAMRVVPGHFKSFGHDYRADTPTFIHAAYQLPKVSDEQMQAVYDTLKQLEIERGERIKASKEQEAAAGEKAKRVKRRTWLRDRRTTDKAEPAIEATPGDAPSDMQ